MYEDECMFVCMYVWNLYKFTFLNRSEPNFAHVSPLVWKRPQGMYVPEILDLSDFWALFLWGPLQNHEHKMAAGATVFRDTLISVIPAGVSRDVTDFYVVADGGVIRGSLISVILEAVPLTSRKLRRSRRQSHPPQRYIPHSSSCFCDLQEITSLQTTVARSYSKCVALSVMRTIR